MDTLIRTTREDLQKNETLLLTQIDDEIDALTRKLETTPAKRSSFHARKDLENRIAERRESRVHIVSGNRMRVFENEVKEYLRADKNDEKKVCSHIDRSQSFLAQSTSSGRQTRKRTTARDIRIASVDTLTATNGASKHLLHDEFLQQYKGKNPTLYMSVGSECSQCHEQMSRIDCAMVCEGCGVSETYIDAETLSFSEEIEYSTFSYRRISHFIDWLGAFQARGSNKIPEEVFNVIMFKLKERKIADIQDITPRLVRLLLKESGLQKYYDQTVLLSCLLSGRTPPRLTPQEEATLKCMFLQIQPVFEKHCPTTRKNFLSYSYVLYKLCELLGLPYYQDGSFSLLKCPEKNKKMDLLWKKICDELRWEFVPSVI